MNQQPLQPEWQSAEIHHALKQDGRFIGADHDSGLEMNSDQWDAQFFPSQTSAKDGSWCQQQMEVIAGAVLLSDGPKKCLGAGSRNDEPRLFSPRNEA